VAFDHPLERTREYVEVVRTILRRESPLEFHGRHFDIPMRGGTGLGRPLKTIVHPLRPDLPIYLAAFGPRNVALAAEIADGWLPTFYSPDHPEAFAEPLSEGLARSGRDRGSLDVAPFVPLIVGREVQACRDLVKPILALYVGGMGARGRNFYNALVSRYGYEAEAARVQDLYREGRRGEAAGAVPDALVDEVALVGPKERIADRLGAWVEAGVDTLIVGAQQPEALEAIAEAAA